MKVEILNRWTKKAQVTEDVSDDTETHLRIRVALEVACKRDADLRGANLSGADLRDAVTDAPVATPKQAIANLDKVREIILDDAARLKMDHWHANEEWQSRTCAEEMLCSTTHCLAGWLQVCSTDEQIRKLAPNVAGLLLAPVAAKMFYAEAEAVLTWLERREYVADSVPTV